LIIATQIDALLPQTQCTRCGFSGCRPYAEAIALGNAPINRCPPGGVATLQRLAALLNQPVSEIDPECGTSEGPKVAVIDAQRCIGCAKCLPACPVDAILGARKSLHRVIDNDCSGCELCIAPCPVDCISMHPLDDEPLSLAQLDQNAQRYRRRYADHVERSARRAVQRQDRLNRLSPSPSTAP